MNLAHLLLRNARLQPKAPALAQGKHLVRTYGELAERVARLAAGLRQKLDLQRGDRVALAMKNGVEYHEVLFACWHAGLVAVPMNAKLHPKEFAYILENSGAKACFVTPDLESAIPGATPVREIERLRAEPLAPALCEHPAHARRENGRGPLLHRRGAGAARLSGPRPLHRHHRLDLR